MASSVGFQYLDTNICEVNGVGYIGAVHLLRLRSGDETCFESNAVQDRLKLSLHPWTEPFDTSVKHLAYELLIQTSL
jgi:hypothetical protein